MLEESFHIFLFRSLSLSISLCLSLALASGFGGLHRNATVHWELYSLQSDVKEETFALSPVSTSQPARRANWVVDNFINKQYVSKER